MPGDRMERMWAPVHFAPALLAPGGIARADCTGILEASLGRELRRWTVTRFVGCLQFYTSGEGSTEFFYGLRVENENVPLGTIDPEPDATADWVTWGGGVCRNDDAMRDAIWIDNRSQRKSQGEQSKLFFYWENAGAANSLYTTFHGRALLLLP